MPVKRNNYFETTKVSTYSLLISCTLFLMLSIDTSITAGSKSDLSEIEVEQILQYSSKSLLQKCDSSLARFSGNSDSAAYSGWEKIEIKSFKNFIVNETKLTFLIIGCGQYGELIVIDSTKETQVTIRREINIPGKHAVLEEIQDLNRDSIPEIGITFSAGAHGMYSSFLSVYKDSTKFLLVEGKSEKFFALTGGIRVLDLDNDGAMEVRIGPDLSKPDSTQYEVYRWNGSTFTRISTH